MPLVIAGATSGSTTVQATDAVTATITLPSTTGTVQLANSALNGSLGATTPSTVAATTITSNGATTLAGGNTTIKGSYQMHLENAAGNDTYAVYNAGSTGTSTYSFRYSSVDRMTLDASGNLLVGQTAHGLQNSTSVEVSGAAGYTIANHISGTASGAVFAHFGYNGGSIGSIAQSGTTAVLYNTTSDYRLKENVAPIQNALQTITALNPVSFTWIDGRPDDGFLAHELQEVLPNCVTGEKDAVNEDGTPKYQQMDNSGVVPFLVKAIQEQQALITQLTARLDAAGIA